jgi:hypothetical protein
MSKEQLPSADEHGSSEASKGIAATHEARYEAQEELANGTIVAKRKTPAHLALVGTLRFNRPDEFDVKVHLPNGYNKWVPVSKEGFENVKDGDEMQVSLRPWEQERYVSELEQIVEKASSFDDLKARFLSFGEIYDRNCRYSIENLVETLSYIQAAKNGTEEISFVFLPEIAGLKEKVVALKGKTGKSAGALEKPEEMSDEYLVKTYQAIQQEIARLISTRDSIEKNLDYSGRTEDEFQAIQKRSQRKIEDAFGVLGTYRDAIDARGLKARTLGELDRNST